MRRSATVTIFRDVPTGTFKLPVGFYMNVEDAAIYLGKSDETVRRYIADGKIEAERQRGTHGLAGWRWIIPTKEINRLRRLDW